MYLEGEEKNFFQRRPSRGERGRVLPDISITAEDVQERNLRPGMGWCCEVLCSLSDRRRPAQRTVQGGEGSFASPPGVRRGRVRAGKAGPVEQPSRHSRKRGQDWRPGVPAATRERDHASIRNDPRYALSKITMSISSAFWADFLGSSSVLVFCAPKSSSESSKTHSRPASYVRESKLAASSQRSSSLYEDLLRLEAIHGTSSSPLPLLWVVTNGPRTQIPPAAKAEARRLERKMAAAEHERLALLLKIGWTGTTARILKLAGILTGTRQGF